MAHKQTDSISNVVDDIALLFIKLPSDISDIVKSYDDNKSWLIAELIHQIRELPSDILLFIKSYSRIGAFGIQCDVISEIKDYHLNLKLWLSIHQPRYRICPNCADYIENLGPMNLLCRCQNK